MSDKKLQIEWERGYICAVANIIHTHGDTVIAKDVLMGCSNPDWTHIDSYDVKTLVKAGLIPAPSPNTTDGKEGGDGYSN